MGSSRPRRNKMTSSHSTDISSHIKFGVITEILERVSQSSSITTKADILKRYIESFEKFRKNYIGRNDNGQTTGTFFPILRLLLPQYDRDRESYGIKVTTLGKLYVRILAIDPHGEVAKKLTTDRYSHTSSTTDFGDTICEIMKVRCAEQSQLTVYEVNRHLDTIAECNQNNNRSKIDDELIQMINGMTAIDQKWLTRIILKKMRLGLGPQKILSVYHPSASDFFDRYVHLSRVCDCVDSGETSEAPVSDPFANKGTIEPMQPFRPMLCQKLGLATFEQQIRIHDFYTETKMDGERFQMHIADGQYKYFSRKGYAYSTEFGRTLTPFIGKLFCVPITNIILDGEMMVWNIAEQTYRTKAENTDVKSIKSDNPVMRPCFCAYDVLYLNNVCLTSKPYAERSRLLQTLFNERAGFLTRCKRSKIRDAEHFMECLNNAFDDKEEGLVVKNADSRYSPGERNAGWWKIKGDYIDGLVSDLDLLIIGGYYRGETIASFLVGVGKKTADEQWTYYAVTKVGGLSKSQLHQINGKLKPYWKRCQTTKDGRSTKVVNPVGIEFGASTPTAWIDPKHSMILEVKGSELVKSTSYGTQYTLRFPRVVSIRNDKPWHECCQLDEFERLCRSDSKVEKLTKRHVNISDMNRMVPPKRSRKVAASKVLAVNTDLAELVQNTVQIDNICAGRDFCMLSTNDKNVPPMAQLKAMVLAHGGRIVENPSAKTFVCVAGSLTNRVTKLKNLRLYNIAKVEWLCRALAGDDVRTKLLDFNRTDMHSHTDELEFEFQQKFDIYGDSFTGKSTVAELKTFLFEMTDNDIPSLSRTELYEMEQMLYEPEKPPNMFQLATALFYDKNVVSAHAQLKLQLARLMFEARGGRCVEQDDDNRFSHLIVVTDNLDRNDLAKFIKSEAEEPVRVISCQWIYDCYNDSKKKSGKPYAVVIDKI